MKSGQVIRRRNGQSQIGRAATPSVSDCIDLISDDIMDALKRISKLSETDCMGLTNGVVSLRKLAFVMRLHETIKKNGYCSDLIELLDPLDDDRCSFKICGKGVKVSLTNQDVFKNWFHFKSNYKKEVLPEPQDWCDYFLALQIPTKQNGYVAAIHLFDYNDCRRARIKTDKIFNLKGKFRNGTQKYEKVGQDFSYLEGQNHSQEVREMILNFALNLTDL